jgi:hypothetical protein
MGSILQNHSRHPRHPRHILRSGRYDCASNLVYVGFGRAIAQVVPNLLFSVLGR